MEKIVIQKMQNDGSYIEEYPRTTQEMVLNLLSSSTKSLMGLEETSTADDAFKQLYLANVLNGKSMVELTFLDSVSNKPLSGIIVTCDKFCDAVGTALTEHTTDDDGKIIAFVSAINPTIKISGYADIEDFSQQLDVSVLGKQFDFSFNLTTNQFKSYLSSQTVKFSGNVLKIDASCCGGGGGGASGRIDSAGRNRYSGGGGGYGVKQSAIDFSLNTSYEIVVGAGGSGGDTPSDGGTSSFIELSASGGQGGVHQSTYANDPKGKGNGNRGYFQDTNTPIDATAGTDTIYDSFTTESLCGGGGCGMKLKDYSERDREYTESSLPGGGLCEGNSSYNGIDGLGGGGAAQSSGGTVNPKGGSGSVNIRMYLFSRS